MSRHPVRFEPTGVTAWVEAGETVLAAARVAGVLIEATCGGRGVCGTCGVRVVSGRLSEPDAEEDAGLLRAPRGTRLACRARVMGPVTVRPLVAARVVHDAATPTAAGTALVAGVDLGTTNVSAAVVERDGGREVGSATVRNQQVSFGGDVLTRVSMALDGHADRLATAARESVAEAVRLASGSRQADLKAIVIAANSAMSALLAGVDPSSLAGAPYTAPDVPVTLAGGLLAGLDPAAEIRIVPPIASFVGGDVLAGLVSLDVFTAPQPALLVDVGTNAEVALWAEGRLTVTSAAAGPAFEGVAGVTGSRLVSTVAELRRTGSLAADGSLNPDAKGVFTGDDGVRAVRLSEDGSTSVISQLDIRSLQLAKAAVRVAVDAVLTRAGLAPEKLRRVWVAGAFGGALDPDDLVAIGMFPAGLRGAIESPGNTSLAGAVSIALSGDSGRIDRLRADVRHVDLAGDPEFGARLLRAVGLVADGGPSGPRAER